MVAALILVWKARRTGSSEKDVVFSVQNGDGNLNTVVRGRHFISAFSQILLKSV